MASVQNIGINGERIKADNERTSFPTGMSKENEKPLNKSHNRESYWFAYSRTEDASPGNVQNDSKTPAELQLQRDREEKMQIFREHQEEERLRKLREMEQQFLQAKRHREQQEEERRRRIEEARIREIERRQQVEERKRQIWEAEQERKEAILRRNMEREARIEARRNAQRNSQCFAFGSSTPRTFDLDLAAIGVGSVLMSSVGRRSEERDTGPPRATSACSLDRKFGEDCMSRSMVSLSSSSTFRGRKRTDITPTPTARERSVTPHITPRGKDSSRSPSRPQSSMSGTSDISASSSSASAVNMRHRPAPRRPRPYSVAGTTSLMSQSMKQEAPYRQPRVQERSAPAQKPQRAKSACREEEKSSRPLSAPKKPVPPPKTTELLARAKSHPVPTKDNLRKIGKTVNKSLPEDKKASTEEKDKSIMQQQDVTNKIECKRKEQSPPPKPDVANPEVQPDSTVTSPMTDSDFMMVSSDDSLGQQMNVNHGKEDSNICTISPSDSLEEIHISDKVSPKEETDNQDIPSKPQVENEEKPEGQATTEQEGSSKDLVPSKPRITSEEEARAALAEKRRLAREQAEREAELERQRLEEIRRQEEEQRRMEEEEQRRMEEEQLRLAELHRQLEEEKLAKAIEEQRQREKEEQEKREEEARQRAEKEEQEKKAREEAEKQRIELEEKLRKEEEERAERKRRVEQIMARTRGKTAAQSPSGSQNENITKSVKNAENNAQPTASNLTEGSESNIACNNVQKVGVIPNGIEESTMAQQHTSVNGVAENHTWQPTEGLPDLLNNTSEIIANHSGQRSNGPLLDIDEQLSKISISSSFTNRTLSANEDVSPQTNGYSSHEEMSCTTSPEENADLLIDIQSCEQRSSIDFTKLVDVEPPSLDNNVNNDNYLIDVDDVNSNLFNPFAETLQKKQDTSVTDLLS